MVRQKEGNIVEASHIAVQFNSATFARKIEICRLYIHFLHCLR